jgi:cytochrome c oxidase subunit 3
VAPHLVYKDLDPAERARLGTFFSIFHLVTALQGVLVLLGLGLIAGTVLFALGRSAGPAKVSPAVELIGLYWHVMILVSMFIFPLLHLIH